MTLDGMVLHTWSPSQHSNRLGGHSISFSLLRLFIRAPLRSLKVGRSINLTLLANPSVAGFVLSAVASNSPVFMIGRTVAGSGAALLIQGAISVITYSSKLKDRSLYIGLVVSCFGISASFSPVLGGGLTSSVSWRWCFWIWFYFFLFESTVYLLIANLVMYQLALWCSVLSFWASGWIWRKIP